MKTVIEMAMDAGLVQESEYFYSPREEEADVHIKDLERLVELARADEREACAKVCESHGPTLANGAMLAEAIRARSNT